MRVDGDPPVAGSAPETEEFGAALRRLRTSRGLSLTDLSRLVHYSKGYLSKIENGGKPAGSDLARRCDQVLRADGTLLRIAERPVAPRVVPACDVPRLPPEPDVPCPFPGLAAFRPHEAAWFAGRDGALGALLDRLGERAGRGPLALVAPSGAGKSSLLNAGLLPALERAGSAARGGLGRRRAVVCTPTAHPLTELRRALGGVGPAEELLLVVDQFEEAFTLCADEEERRTFVRVLCLLAAPVGPDGSGLSAANAAALAAAGLTELVEAARGGRPTGAAVGAAAGIPHQAGPVPPVAEPVPAGSAGTPESAVPDSADRAATAPPVVVLGVRADFCGRCLEHPELVPVFTHGLLALGPMTGAELRESITRPTTRAGLLLEPGLVEVLLRDLGLPAHDAGADPGLPEPHSGPGPTGVLPLLSHTLLATWQQREGRALTVAGYLRTGGIHGAIAATAENVFTRLSPAEQQTARHLLLRLVHVSDDSEETRRPVGREQLLQQLPKPGPPYRSALVPDATVPAGAATWSRPSPAAVLDAFVRARLLTVDSETVSITHEALLRAWPRLRGWLHADRAGLLVRQQLTEAAAEWERERRDPALLYQGARLAAAREWIQDPSRFTALAPREAAFLTASHDQEYQRRRTARRQVRRDRQLLVTLAALLVLAVAAGGLAYQQRAAAFAERRIAQSRAMAAESAALAAGRPEASMLLADEAYRTAPTAEARSALLSTQAQPFAGRLLGHTGPVNAVAFSPDGTLLATASSDGTLKLWTVADRRLEATLTGHGGSVKAVAFSPDGRTVVSGSSDGTVRLWDVADRQPTVTLFGHGGVVRTVAYSPDGRTVVSGGADRTVRVWDTASHTLLSTLTGHTDEVLAVACGPDGRTIASAGADQTVRIWDTTSHTLLSTLTGHTDEVLGLAFGPDGHTLASAGADRTIRLWDPAGHTLLATLTGHSDDVNSVAYADRGATLVSASGDGTVRLWDVASRRPVATLYGHTDYVQGVAVSSDGELLASAGFDQSAVLWDRGAAALTLHPFSEIWQSVVSPDGRTVAAADADHAVTLWDVARRTVVATLRGHGSSVFGVAFSPDGRLLASAGADGTVRLWDVAEGRQVALLSGHRGSVFAVAFSPDGRLLASAGEDRTVRLWDVRARRPLGILSGHTDFVNAVAFGPDGRTIASGSDDLTVRLWDVSGRRPIATLTGHTGAVRGVAFAPDGRTLASAGNDGTVRTWDTAGQRLTATLTGHTGSVRGVAFAPDGRTLASAGNDGTVRTWDTVSHELTTTLTGHGGAVWSVSFSPDGGTLASSGSDGTVRLWTFGTRDRQNGICRELAGGPDRWAKLLPEQPYRSLCG
ncbi:helix-turn-helix domain-containing protein [Kitasatospora sp. NPDC052896]|uniref:nSTAND1 domain-containing NTPase n=1 Tax=Kitasatospora sp. NPDC052896 TaxID=3364061 RepID=UPI0037C69C2E